MKIFVRLNEDNRVTGFSQQNARNPIQPDDRVDATEIELPSDFARNFTNYIFDNGSFRLATDEENAAIDFPDEDYWIVLRADRNRLLAECDWTQAVDAPLTEQKKSEWQTYRTALRTLPDTTTDPRNPDWH